MLAPAPSENPFDARSRALGDEITELYGYITAATYELLVRIREFDADDLWQVGGVCSCAHWLNWKCGIGMNAAREKVRVARALADLPKISAAFRAGEISYSKVRAMTRVAHPGNEDFLLQIATHGTAHHVETLVRGYRRAKRLNDAELAEKQHEHRSFCWQWDDDGSLTFKGRLPGEVGAMLLNALDKAVDRVRRDDLDEKDDVTAETWLPIEVQRADALAGMAESYLANGPASSSSADRYQVMVHVTAETLAGDVTAETRDGEVSHLEHGPHVTAETSRRLCCDASITRMVEDGKGEPLSIGRKSRVIPPAMRRALRARDRQCRFPGCTHRHFIDGHHIRHWADGGETGLDNLVQLCRHHHRLVHEGGFACGKDAAGRVVFRDRNGEQIPDSGWQPPRRTDNVVIDLRQRLQDRFIHERTCVTGWEGETMDMHLAVGAMFDCDDVTAETRQPAQSSQTRAGSDY